jgi:hypothetical protein
MQGGSWSWSGPNNFSAATRAAGISNIQASQAGNYVATYTKEGCQSTLTFTVTVNMNEDVISLHPNPASSGGFTILLPEITENTVVKIYDNLGRILYQKVAKGSNKIEIDSKFPAGLYYVSINSKGFNIIKKLVVQ